MSSGLSCVTVARPISIYSSCCVVLFLLLKARHPPSSTLFPYTTLFRSWRPLSQPGFTPAAKNPTATWDRSEEHTSELHHVSISYAVFCLKKKKDKVTVKILCSYIFYAKPHIDPSLRFFVHRW